MKKQIILIILFISAFSSLKAQMDESELAAEDDVVSVPAGYDLIDQGVFFGGLDKVYKCSDLEWYDYLTPDGLIDYLFCQEQYEDFTWYRGNFDGSNTIGFESSSDNTTDANGNVLNVYGIWIQPVTDAFIRNIDDTSASSAYIKNGDNSMAIDGPGSRAGDSSYKEEWGNIATDMLDASGSNMLRLNFNYVVINNSLTTEDATGLDNSFTVDFSIDGGDTWITDRTFTMETLEEDFYKTTNSTFKEVDVIIAADNHNITFSNTTKIRIKSRFNDDIDDKFRVYLDDIALYTNSEDRYFINEMIPEDEESSLSETFSMDIEGFEDSENTPWGIWNDGGVDAYTTESNVFSGLRTACIKGYYDQVWLEDEDDEWSGEKEYYSSIYTENLDFRPYEEIQMNFSFVAKGMGFAPEDITKYNNTEQDDSADSFSLWVSRDAGINFTHIKRWTAGVDFNNDIVYEDISVVIPNNIFEGDPYDSNYGFTSDVVLKIQCEGDDETDYVYIDDISISGHGSTGNGSYITASLDFSNYDSSYLVANTTSSSVYDYINSNLIKPSLQSNYVAGSAELDPEYDGSYGAVEHSDCSHFNGEENGITIETDEDLGYESFVFNVFRDVDTDRCKPTENYKNQDIVGVGNPDRQRLEIKSFEHSEDFQLGVYGETHIYAWKFKLPEGFLASDNFTHIHQLKSVGSATEDGMPLITYTVQGEKYKIEDDPSSGISTPQMLRIRYSPDATSQRNLTSVETEAMLGQWVEAYEVVTFGEWGEDASYRLLLRDMLTGNELLEFETHSLRMWKEDASFIRAKWGVYRSLLQAHANMDESERKLRDEKVKFADVSIIEVNESFDINSMSNLWEEVIEQVGKNVEENIETPIDGALTYDSLAINRDASNDITPTALSVNGKVLIDGQDIGEGAGFINTDYQLYVGNINDDQGGVATEDIAISAKDKWIPDFVFSKNYCLSTLSELETYLQNNRHLPNVPSANDLKDKGHYSINDMIFGQLQNLEETYLHAIRQEKNIQQQKESLNRTSKRIVLLQEKIKAFLDRK